MKSIQFKRVNCRNCYKCVRTCPVKSIAVKDEQSQVMDDECILCGACLAACPQNAKSVRSDLELVRSFVKDGYRVCATVAPSYAAAFEVASASALLPAMKQLGFLYAEETAVGAALVSREYAALMQAGNMSNIISTCCPTVVFLVEKYYPDLIPLLAPVISPMVASARRLKARFGNHTKVVFVGPCLSKREECEDFDDKSVDATLTFSELAEWMEEAGADFSGSEDPAEQGNEIARARLYPLPGGVIGTIPEDQRGEYQCIGIDGISHIMQLFDELLKGELRGFFIEANSCIGGCLSGPCMPEIPGGLLRAHARMKKYYESTAPIETFSGEAPEMGRLFTNREKIITRPSEAAIREILTKIGKPTPDKELNCGSCGYPTCVKKAEAVYLGKAELHMCLPYMRERAESMSNLIVDATPNGIMVLNEELLITDMNTAAEKMLRVIRSDAIGCHIFEYLISDDFESVLSSGEPILDKKTEYSEYGVAIYQTVLYVPEQHSLVVLLRDVSAEEQQRKHLAAIQFETIETAQRVIDKQMSVAQEIASLLGETTAETKAILTKLQGSMRTEAGDKR